MRLFILSIFYFFTWSGSNSFAADIPIEWIGSDLHHQQPSPEVKCPEKHHVVALWGQEQGGYGLIDLWIQCSDGSAPRLTGKQDGVTRGPSKCPGDFIPVGIHIVSQDKYGVVDAKMVCGTMEDPPSLTNLISPALTLNPDGYQNFRGTCPIGTRVSGLKLLQTHGLKPPKGGRGVTNVKFYCR